MERISLIEERTIILSALFIIGITEHADRNTHPVIETSLDGDSTAEDLEPGGMTGHSRLHILPFFSLFLIGIAILTAIGCTYIHIIVEVYVAAVDGESSIGNCKVRFEVHRAGIDVERAAGNNQSSKIDDSAINCIDTDPAGISGSLRNCDVIQIGMFIFVGVL